MTDTLAATVNRSSLHSLEVPDSFETDGSFTVELRNRGQATHVHLHLDDALSEVAELEAGNHYVEGDSTRAVRVHVDDVTGTVRGKLKIVTAYGAETHWVDVELSPPKKAPVDVDPSLSKPNRAASDGGFLAGVAVPDALSALPAVVLGLVAVVLALGSVLSPGGTDVVLAVVAVVAGGLAAAYLLLR